MKVSSEDPSARNHPLQLLWRRLDPSNRHELSLSDLKRSLTHIDHPLKNADTLLKDTFLAIDRNEDEKIQYEEFRSFAEIAEKPLYMLFQSIDRDQDGRLCRKDVENACIMAGLSLPNSNLDHLFAKLDQDGNGYIDFSEWREFLLFAPTYTQVSIKTVLSLLNSVAMSKDETHTVPPQKNSKGRDSLSLISKIFYGALSKIVERPAASPRTFGRTNPLQATANHLSVSEKDCCPSPEPSTTIIDNACASTTKSMSLLSDILPPPGYYISGAAAGVLSRTFTAPLDRIKVYLIADVSPSNEPRLSLKETLSLKSTRRIGQPLIDACKIIWRSGGLGSFFAGNGLNVVKVMPESGIKFGSFETAKRTFARFEGHGEPQKIRPLSNFICGGIAGGISQLFVYPIDTLKFRMQCETIQGGMHGNKLIMATAKKMYTQGAIQTAYRGLAMGLVGIFPYAAIDLGTFEYLKKEITQRNIRVRGCSEEEAVPSSLTLGFVGAVSGTFGASIVYPINVVRTRLQAQGTALHPPTYTGVWDVTRKTIESQGLKGLFKGITPNLLKVVPAVSITYMVYESSKKVLHLQ